MRANSFIESNRPLLLSFIILSPDILVLRFIGNGVALKSIQRTYSLTDLFGDIAFRAFRPDSAFLALAEGGIARANPAFITNFVVATADNHEEVPAPAGPGLFHSLKCL